MQFDDRMQHSSMSQSPAMDPFAFIDKDVEIGDGCEIMPYASVLNGTRMGRNNRVYQGAIIGADLLLRGF